MWQRPLQIDGKMQIENFKLQSGDEA